MKFFIEISVDDVLEWAKTNDIKVKPVTKQIIGQALIKMAPELLEDIYRCAFQTIEFRLAAWKQCGHPVNLNPDWSVVERKVREALRVKDVMASWNTK